ncbi:MAG: glycine cleavage system protein GcvH [Deltaproteobacteria bacterium]|nr:glycine cleavage system protein GcvH [Deltaproteobacteria bacterium]MCB9786983.1 glycine cleavage system protein GcvH [Deltaproteobacteria bacterium]
MSNVDPDRFYSKEHEWALPDPDEDGVVIVGVSDYAAEQLGDIVMVELPAVGDTFDQDEPFGTVESPKSVSEVFSPVSGEVIAVNDALEDAPELVNDSPYAEGWMVKIRLADDGGMDALMSATDYEAFLEDLEES